MASNYALITGASAGIGKEFARIHAQNGGNLIIVARREDKLTELQKELDSKYKIDVKIFAKDLSNPKAIDELFDEINKDEITVEYLINNAGFGWRGYFHQSRWQTNENMIMLNVLSLTKLTYKFLPSMLKRNSGKILNVASSAAMVPGGPLQAVYFATKAYVLSFTYGLIGELEGSNVTATALLPGATLTEFQDVAGLNGTKLFNKVKYKGDTVAKEGYNAMMKGKAICLTALKLKDSLPLRIMSFLPKKLVLKTVKSMQEKQF